MKRKLKFLSCIIFVTTALKGDLNPCHLILDSSKEAIYNWCVMQCPDQGEKVQDCIKYYDVGQTECFEKTEYDMSFPGCSN